MSIMRPIAIPGKLGSPILDEISAVTQQSRSLISLEEPNPATTLKRKRESTPIDNLHILSPPGSSVKRSTSPVGPPPGSSAKRSSSPVGPPPLTNQLYVRSVSAEDNSMEISDDADFDISKIMAVRELAIKLAGGEVVWDAFDDIDMNYYMELAKNQLR